MKRALPAFLLLALTFGIREGDVHADEGMWTFDHPPLAQLRAKYGFTLTAVWLNHLRLASVRFNDGGSGSFVSPHGLVITEPQWRRGRCRSSRRHARTISRTASLRPQGEELKCPTSS